MNVRVTARRFVLPVVVLALVAATAYVWVEQRRGSGPAPPPVAARDDPRIVEAWREERSGLTVESIGRVERVLADDREGSRHQRFILRLDNGHTLLVSHNIDLAPRVPLEVGDRVHFRGRYEWNERGGVIHWTHHDPDGRGRDGWLVHDERVYR